MHYNLLIKIGRHFVPFTVPSVVVVVVICHSFLFVCPVMFVVVAVASVLRVTTSKQALRCSLNNNGERRRKRGRWEEKVRERERLYFRSGRLSARWSSCLPVSVPTD